MAALAGRRGKKIVVAVDEGEESMHALSWCLKNVVSDVAVDDGGNSPRDTLLLLHAKSPPSVFSSVDGTGYLYTSAMMETMNRYAAETADSVLAKAKRACNGLQNVNVETKVESGDPRDVICETVEKMGADTLVMGSHGYGPFKRAFVGSVSHHCAQNVKCPVLIVKKPQH